MSKPSAPEAPDPKETAAAQTGTNISTALANATLGNVNQYGPDGSVTYEITGYQDVTDPTTGTTYKVPQYSQTTALSENQQAIKDQTDAASLNLGTIANEQSAFLQDYLGKPVDMSSANVEKYINTHFGDDFNKQWDKQQAALETQLANKGIQVGSQAYNDAMQNLSTSRSNAYDNMYGNQYGLATQQMLAERNQPLNEITALLGGSQVGTPTFGAPTNPQSVPTVDYAGLVQQDYANQMNAYNAQMQQQQGLLGGLFGLGSALIMSDKRSKTDIKPIGRLYEFRYKGEKKRGKPHVGVMAQEVEKSHPEAVMTGSDGMKRVDYGALFEIGRGKA